MVEGGFRERVERRNHKTALDRVMRLLPKLTAVERAMVHEATSATAAR